MKNKRTIAIILSIVLIVMVVIGGTFGFYVLQLYPVSSEPNQVEFMVEPGETSSSVVQRLVKAKIIRNDLVAKVYMRISGNSDIKAGLFVLDTSWNTKQVISVLNDPKKAGAEQVTVTITEGSWAKDIAKLMAENTNVTAEELMALWNDKDYINGLMQTYPFLTEDIFKSEHVYLEGYLFPETYAFFKVTTAKDITTRFLDHTKEVLARYQNEIDNSKLTIHEIMTLSSIVQYEGSKEEDMKLIASVFYNRLNIGMKLESSVTVCYALYDFKSWKDCETNSNISSKYNTYKVNGLPPGPILNPGEKAIYATLNPTASDYLFFMADVYGDGTVYFAKTYAEHALNVLKYLY